VAGSGIPNGNTVAGAAKVGSGVTKEFGWTFATDRTKSPSSTSIRNANMMVRIVAVFLARPSALLKRSDG
jgi:hypothetical protein